MTRELEQAAGFMPARLDAPHAFACALRTTGGVCNCHFACGVPISPEPVAPWPLVSECHLNHRADHSCPQCDGGHDHQWKAWHDAPESRLGSGTTVVDGNSGPGIPVRCTTCGARKCDLGPCLLRRHHRGPHEEY